MRRSPEKDLGCLETITDHMQPRPLCINLLLPDSKKMIPSDLPGLGLHKERQVHPRPSPVICLTWLRTYRLDRGTSIQGIRI